MVSPHKRQRSRRKEAHAPQSFFTKVSDRTGAPARSFTLLTGLSLVMLIAYYLFNGNLQTAFLIPSGAAVLVYVIGSSAGVKLLGDRGARRCSVLARRPAR